MWFAAPLPPPLLIASLLVVFGAGIVRGFAGLAPAQFRRYVPNLLLLIASISVLRAGLDVAA